MSAAPHLLLDIEGTTTPVTFVSDVLFPFARRRLRAFLAGRASDPEVRACLVALEGDHGREAAPDPPPRWNRDEPVASASAYLEWLMDRDRKATPLKTLQGMIWEDGFRTGALVAPVYDDVRPAFERWRAAAREIAIFSSGSVLAQKLLFAHTSAGDLTGFLSGHFDTTTGPKREPRSYHAIAAALGQAPPDLLFVSDVAAELDAAGAADMRTALCVREGAAEPRPAAHAVIRSFAELA